MSTARGTLLRRVGPPRAGSCQCYSTCPRSQEPPFPAGLHPDADTHTPTAVAWAHHSCVQPHTSVCFSRACVRRRAWALMSSFAGCDVSGGAGSLLRRVLASRVSDNVDREAPIISLVGIGDYASPGPDGIEGVGGRWLGSVCVRPQGGGVSGGVLVVCECVCACVGGCTCYSAWRCLCVRLRDPNSLVAGRPPQARHTAVGSDTCTHLHTC
jgi:hypothetical protein